MTIRTTCTWLAALLPLVFIAPDLQAQNGADATTFTFGPSLRSSNVFSYRFTERVRAIHEVGGEVLDSSTRELTYYLSQRQTPLDDGRWQIEANIDSMRVRYIRGGADTLVFNTQELIGRSYDQTNREILGPSALVNRVALITLSPYGDVLKITGDLPALVEQLDEPSIDPVTRERIRDMVTPEYLTSVLLPFRSILPLGQTVRLGDTLTRRIGSAIDRVPFATEARVVVTRESGRPTASFSAPVGNAVRPLASFTELLEPVKVQGIDGMMAGGLMLDLDGVVQSGWTTLKGTIHSEVEGTPLTTTVWHETVTETIGIMPFE